MNVVSTRLSDDELKMMQAARGDKPVAMYLKELIIADAQRAKREAYEYEQILADIARALKELQKKQEPVKPQNNTEVLAAINEMKEVLLIIGSTMPAALTALRNAGHKK